MAPGSVVGVVVDGVAGVVRVTELQAPMLDGSDEPEAAVSAPPMLGSGVLIAAGVQRVGRAVPVRRVEVRRGRGVEGPALSRGSA